MSWGSRYRHFLGLTDTGFWQMGYTSEFALVDSLFWVQKNFVLWENMTKILGLHF